MAEAIHSGEGEHAAVLFYGACLLVTTSLLGGLARYASGRAELVPDEATRTHLRWAADAISPSLGFSALVIVLAAFAPRVAVFGFLALAIRAIVGTR
jgi:hypothetical protein